MVGLIFEALGSHKTGLALGNSIRASSLVLAAFMSGLATGNGFAAALGQRLRRPLARRYADAAWLFERARKHPMEITRRALISYEIDAHELAAKAAIGSSQRDPDRAFDDFLDYIDPEP